MNFQEKKKILFPPIGAAIDCIKTLRNMHLCSVPHTLNKVKNIVAFLVELPNRILKSTVQNCNSYMILFVFFLHFVIFLQFWHIIDADREKLASSDGKFAQYLCKILEVYFSYHLDSYGIKGLFNSNEEWESLLFLLLLLLF